MKSCVLVVLVALVVVQTTYGQCLRTAAPSIIGSCGCGAPGCGCGPCGCDTPICGPSYIASPATTYGPCLGTVASSIIGSCGCGAPGCGCVPPGCGCVPCGCDMPVCCPSYIASPCTIPATIVQSNSVASSLADTLSLLTVSSLLADTLPLGSCGCCYGGPGYCCGCGGCGYGGCGYGGYYC